jgi:hypothetical protein
MHLDRPNSRHGCSYGTRSASQQNVLDLSSAGTPAVPSGQGIRGGRPIREPIASYVHRGFRDVGHSVCSLVGARMHRVAGDRIKSHDPAVMTCHGAHGRGQSIGSVFWGAAFFAVREAREDSAAPTKSPGVTPKGRSESER